MESTCKTNTYTTDITSVFDIPSLSKTTDLKDFLTGCYRIGTTNYSFTDTSRDETFTADLTDKRQLKLHKSHTVLMGCDE